MKKIDGLLSSAFENMGIQRQYNENKVLHNWKLIVGEDIYLHSSPIRFENKVLHVIADHPVWCHHLLMMKKDIIGKINNFLKTNGVTKDIRFTVGSLPKEEFKEAEESYPLKKQMPLDASEQQNIDTITLELNDDLLRGKIRKLIAKDFSQKKFLRKKMNWKNCSCCGIPYNGASSICSHCQREESMTRKYSIQRLLREIPWMKYEELSQCHLCTREEYIEAKEELKERLSEELFRGTGDRLIEMTLVMLITGWQPQEVTQEKMENILKKFRGRKYVSASRRR